MISRASFRNLSGVLLMLANYAVLRAYPHPSTLGPLFLQSHPVLLHPVQFDAFEKKFVTNADCV
eukprot:CAMPEP_0118652492 /NCGR_PEP_ID=MMETSP0785-20121206/11347_1 /TAXON_ID=91992 /ORGANISM="Bolidomonas pacifica, Strain CCMP 1866" /LENGTH=63 /DNA_ID=CAMNT_0006545013 /DNA_START=239 /DNA_END=430 /DNA_ORIENTATION=-